MAFTAAASGDSARENDLSGRQLGDYRLLRRLGRGAMAEVYLAQQGSLERQVAFKVLRGNLSSDDNYVRRFHREAQAAASLVHANIVQIHEVGFVEGVHFIAQEYVPGSNLAEYMVRRGTPDVGQVVAILRQVAAALNKADERGIVHRDIKPENIMLAPSGEVKVADFGLARLSGDDKSLGLTQIGFTMGTPLYMSPEQVEGKQLDIRSDLYSLGVTAYQMLSGQAPFRGDTALSVAVQHLKSVPERLENLRPDLPPALCRIVHRLLAKDPHERFISPRELLAELRGILPGDAESAGFETVPSALGEGSISSGRLAATQRLASVMATAAMPAVEQRRFHRLIAGLVATAFLLGLAIAWFLREPLLLSPASASPPIAPSNP